MAPVSAGAVTNTCSCSCSCGGLQPAPPHCSPPSPPPQKLPPSITTGWAHCRRRRRHDPRNIRTLSSQTYSTRTPTPHLAVTTIIIIHRGLPELSCGYRCFTARAVIHQLLTDLERVVASAALRNDSPPSSSSQGEAHHASDKGAFLSRVLVEPDHSATTIWASLGSASCCENG